MKRTRLITLLLISAMAPFALFANGNSETATSQPTAAAPQEPVTIEYWTSQTQTDRQATIQLLIDTFEATNPNIKVKLIAVDENDLASQLATATNAHTAPTIIEGSSDSMVAFGADGLMDTKANQETIDAIGKDKFFDGALKMNESPDGQPYGVPYHGWLQGIWYRTDWFKQAGLEPPTTWENIEKAAKYFYKPSENTYGILVGTKSEVFTEQCFTPIALSNGANIFDSKGNLTFDTPQMKEAIEYYARLAKYNPPGPQTWRARDYYLQGKMAMFFYSTYIMDDLAIQDAAASSLTSDNFKDLQGSKFDPELASHTGMVPTITHTDSASYGTIISLGILKQDDTAKTQAAEKFIQFLYQPNSYITFLHMAPGGMNPVIKGIADNPEFLNNPVLSRYGKKSIDDLIDGMQDIKSFGIVDGVKIEKAASVTSQQIIPQMIYKITQENMDVDAAMAWAESEIKAIN
ncbi:MAG: extracellular solute-binding protein [Spirochaetia bacterium]|jgi:multiple sugar transport system substrate-binding protein|nr:extracellular solute-binding protein [Spirochaetia bacterium]